MLSSEMLISLDQGTMEVPVQDLDQDQINQIDVTKVSGKQYHRPATSSGEEPHQAIQEGSTTKASIVSNAALEKSERKGKIDKAYRERCKVNNFFFFCLIEGKKEKIKKKNNFTIEL